MRTSTLRSQNLSSCAAAPGNRSPSSLPSKSKVCLPSTLPRLYYFADQITSCCVLIPYYHTFIAQSPLNEGLKLIGPTKMGQTHFLGSYRPTEASRAECFKRPDWLQEIDTRQSATSGVGQPPFQLTVLPVPVDFGNIKYGGQVTDRLGTVRNGTMYSYFPWGEPRTSNTARVFTYIPDASGQDYADQRYYNQINGRFWTADQGNPDPSNPASWNKYNYASGDPVNRADPSGADDCPAWGLISVSGVPCGFDTGLPPWCLPALSGNSFTPSWGDPLEGITCLLAFNAAPPQQQAAPPPQLCTAESGLTNDQVEAVEAVMGENSWIYIGYNAYQPGDSYGHPTGPVITENTVETEDIDMFSVLTNRTIAPGYPTTIGAVASQQKRGRYQFSGYPAGIGFYNSAIASNQGSPQCNDLTDVVFAMNYVGAYGSQLPGKYLFWKAQAQMGRKIHVPRPGDIYVGRTVFESQNVN